MELGGILQLGDLMYAAQCCGGPVAMQSAASRALYIEWSMRTVPLSRDYSFGFARMKRWVVERFYMELVFVQI